MDADGSGQLPLGKGRQPAWSPDGRRLAFIRDGALWTSDPVGRAERQLPTGVPTDASPVWSPDGQRIAFARQGGYLEVIPADGGSAAQLARGLNDRPQSFVWSRDSRSLLYANAYVLYRVAVDATSDEVVLRAPNLVGGLALSPDGRTLAFSVWPFPQTAPAGVWTLALAGSTTRQLTHSGEQLDGLLTWSSAGDEIAFTRSNDVRIHVVQASTSKERTLPREHPGTQFDSLAWSPDGARLLFATTYDEDTELYSLPPAPTRH